MEYALAKLEEIVFLEYEIGVLLSSIEYAFQSGLIVQICNQVVTTKEFVRFQEKRIVQKEERHEALIQDILLENTLEELEMVHKVILQMPNGTVKNEKLFMISYLIELKYRNMEEMIL